MIPGSGLLSPVQQEKRAGLKMSISQPNMRKPTGLGFADFHKASVASNAAAPPVPPAHSEF